MSFAAAHWAMSQRLQAVPKMILIILADHHNGETGQCNPSVKRISEMAGVTQRTVEIHMKAFVEQRLVTIIQNLREDGSRRTNQYNLALDTVLATPGSGPGSPPGEADALLEPIIEPVREPGTPKDSSVETPESFGPLAQKTNTGFPNFLEKDPVFEKYVADHAGEFEALTDSASLAETWAEWFSLGHGMKGWTVSYEIAEAWRVKSDFTEEYCLDKIYVVRGWWTKEHEKNGRDPYATFQRACREDWGAQLRMPKGTGGKTNGKPGPNPPSDYDKETEARAERLQGLADSGGRCLPAGSWPPEFWPGKLTGASMPEMPG